MKKLKPNLLTFLLSCQICYPLTAAINERVFRQYDDDGYTEQNNKMPCILSMLKKHLDTGKYQHGALVMINIPKVPDLITKRILWDLNENKDHKTAVVINFAGTSQRTVVAEEALALTTVGKQTNMVVPSKTKCYILMLTRADELSDIIVQIKSQPSWNPTAPFVVIFTETMTEFTLMVQTKSVLQEFFEHSVVDVNVISSRHETLVMQSQTWFPYEGRNCGDSVITVRTINECEYFGQGPEVGNGTSYDDAENSDESLEDDGDDDELFLLQYDFSNLGPKVPSNLHGCPIRVAASTLEPFVIKRNGVIREGFEIIMTKVISEQMNLNPIFKEVDSDATTRVITNNSITGLYADVVNAKVDVMIGGLFENNVSREILSSSIPYMDDELTWCVPPAKNAPTWMNAFGVFDIMTWMIALVLVFLTGLMLYGLMAAENKRNENYMWCTLVAMCVSINVPAPYKPTTGYIRVFLASFFLYGVHFNAGYQSYLVSVLTRPRFEKQVDNVRNAIDEGFTFTGGENTLSLFRSDDSDAAVIKSKYEICPQLDKCLARLKDEDNIAVATSRLHAMSNSVIARDKLFCFPKTENIHSHGIKLFVRKDYHLLPKFNELLRQVAESGLFGKWLREADALKSSAKLKQLEAARDSTVPLQLKHLQGAFGLLLLGFSVAISVFAIELGLNLICRRYKYRWAIYLEQFFLA